MNKILKQISHILSMGILLFIAIACDDDRTELTSVEYDRLFTPTSLSFRVNQVDVTATWGCLSSADTVSYIAQIFINDTEMAFEGTPTAEYTSSTLSCLMEGLEGATTYSFRVKAVGQSKESDWATSTFQTATEQILESVASADIGGTYITLRWPAGETAQTIVLTPTNSSLSTITYTITDDDIANGYAYIEGLTPESEYTAVMYSASGSIRGQRTFTTTIDTGGMTLVEEGEDLIAAIEADNGEGLYLTGSTYDLGEYELTKSITIAALPANRPTINGRFKVTADITSISLANLIFDGEGSLSNVLEITDNNSVGTISFEGCDILNMSSHIIYGNTGSIGDITINNCIWDNIAGNGGDGLDFREGGKLNSITVTNTTFSNGIRTFLRCQAELTGNISFTNCTFYNICNVNNSNNSGLFRITNGANSTLTVHNCIFYGIGFDGASGNMGVWARTGSNMAGKESYQYNYWYNSPNLWGGLYATDNASVATEADPGFVDAENGDFTITNEDMIYYEVGDTRWLQ